MKSETKSITYNTSRGMAVVILLSLTVGGVFAQETQYISDMVLVPVRSGAGSQFRIVNRGLPSGTALLVYAQSDDGEWTDESEEDVEAARETDTLVSRGDKRWNDDDDDRDRSFSGSGDEALRR